MAETQQPSRRAGTPQDPDHALMARIQERWGQEISLACRTSSVLPEFLAALIANESAGNEKAQRFEPKIFEVLKAVRDGSKKSYGTITRALLEGKTDPHLHFLASSLGLTQIMGYHALARGEDAVRLFNPEFNLHFAVKLLAYFAEHWGLDFTKDFADFFRGWNTGSPDGVTHDASYVANGLKRLAIYRELEKSGL